MLTTIRSTPIPQIGRLFEICQVDIPYKNQCRLLSQSHQNIARNENNLTEYLARIRPGSKVSLQGIRAFGVGAEYVFKKPRNVAADHHRKLQMGSKTCGFFWLF